MKYRVKVARLMVDIVELPDGAIPLQIDILKIKYLEPINSEEAKDVKTGKSEETEVFELYHAYREAWDKTPKARMKVVNTDGYNIYTCPNCGFVFCRAPQEEAISFPLPLFCCGKLMV